MKRQILVNTSKNFMLMDVTSPKDLSKLNLVEPVILKLSMDLVNIDDFQNYLSKANLENLQKIKDEREKIRFIKTRGLVNMIFSLENGKVEPIWQLNSYGKPYINGWDKDFSISHSREFSIVALANEAIGIDIEDNGRDIELEKFKRTKFLNFDESAYKSKEEFFTHFTALEAYLKYIGKGFHKDARTVCVKKTDEGIVINDGELIKAEVIRDGGYTIAIVTG